MLICRNAAAAPGEKSALAFLPLMLVITELYTTASSIKDV
jgi:hypothetical protein